MRAPSERRAAARRRVDLSATAVFEEGCARVPAHVRNVSESGAKVDISPDHKLPETFYMLMPQHQLQPCRVVWRRDGALGLAFLP